MRLSLKLLVLVLLAAVPVFAVQVYEELKENERRRAAAAEQVLQLARLAAARQDQFIEGARYLLTAAAQLHEVRERDPDGCSARMVEFRRELPAISGIGAIDPGGDVFCTSTPPARPINLADRSYVRNAIERRTMSVSGYIVGRKTGAGSLNFAYPVTDDFGQVQAVLILAFGLDRLSQSMAEMTLPPGTSMSLLDHAGILLARAPPAPDWVGRESRAALLMEGTPLTARYGFQAEGIDGVTRVYAVAPLDSSGELFISVGLPLEGALAEADRPFWEGLALLSVVFAAAAILAWLGGERAIRRPILLLQDAAQRLAKGDLSARLQPSRAGTAEIAALAASFDAMAQSLQAREQALRDSEQRFRDVAESASDWIWESDAEHRFSFFSKRLSELTGADPRRWLGRRRDEILTEVAPPGDLAAHLTDLAAHRPFRNFTYWFQTPNGAICASISGKPVFAADGGFLGYRGTGSDITEVKLAEEQRARLAAIVESSRDAIFTWTLDGTITSWNAEAERIYGYSAEEAIGRSVRLMIPQDGLDASASIVARVRRGEFFEQYETVRIRKDGRRIDVSLTLSPIRDATGAVVAGSTIARDITQRKLAEAALRESEQRFKDVVEASSDSVWETDRDLRFTYVSDRGLEFSGLARDSYIGKTVEELLTGRAAADKVADHMALLRARQPFRNFVYWIERPQGRCCYSISGTPRFDGDGNFLGFRGVGSDITERQLADERQTLLMAELDHRVKNILATVQSVALHSLPVDAATDSFVGRLAALAHAHSLLAQGRWEGAELGALITEELTPYRTKDVEQIRLAGPPLLLAPKAAQVLTMAMHELVTNAAKYGALSTPNGRVEIAWLIADAADGRRLSLTWVEHDGPPVTPPSRRGFGSTLIERSLSYELDGTARLEFPRDGMRCTIEIPLDSRVTQSPRTAAD